MTEPIHTFSFTVRGTTGLEYAARVSGTEREDGTWAGWIEFVPMSGGATLRTDRETTQPDRAALAYWAGGLEPVYLEGALSRATP